jgi:acetyltransferase-like isoleucine patch superfamily enzyme
MGGGSSVGEGVFCGTSSVVLPNTAVGAWSVCGAGAVVTSEVPERSLAVGIPAKVVKSL